MVPIVLVGAALLAIFAATQKKHTLLKGVLAGALAVGTAVAKPFESLWSDIFGHSSKPKVQAPIMGGGYAGSSGVASLTPIMSGTTVQGIEYQTKPGDTVTGLAARAGVTTGVFAADNPNLQVQSPGSDQIDAGQNVEIPCPVGTDSAGCIDALSKAFGSGN
jgi:hypothetical protein